MEEKLFILKTVGYVPGIPKLTDDLKNPLKENGRR